MPPYLGNEYKVGKVKFGFFGLHDSLVLGLSLKGTSLSVANILVINGFKKYDTINEAMEIIIY